MPVNVDCPTLESREYISDQDLRLPYRRIADADEPNSMRLVLNSVTGLVNCLR